MEFVPFTPDYAAAAAEIHAEGQPGTFLTRLGHKFLTRLYECIAESPRAFGYVVVDGEAVGGVGVVALDTTQMFADIKRRYWYRLAWPVIVQIARNPLLVKDIIQSIRYPQSLSAPPDEAEVLFLGLKPAYMRQGIAVRLIYLLMDESYKRGCPSATTLIDKRNRAIRWTIATLPGVYIDHEMQLYGKTMLVYRAPLPMINPSETTPEPAHKSADEIGHQDTIGVNS